MSYKAKIYKSNKEKYKLSLIDEKFLYYKNTDGIPDPSHIDDVENNLINIHPEVTYQNFGGIGGAFSDTAATSWSKLSKDKQKEFIEAYFSREKGIGYTFGRLSIASCDFSTEDYTYLDGEDETLNSFNLNHDKKNIFPMVYEAQKFTELTLFASPWSPPAFMKTNNNRIGGKLKTEYYELWAEYIKKYIDECKKNNINLWGLTLQNEPRAHQIWESCIYLPKEEETFLGVLGKKLENYNIKLLCYDHCRERVFERALSVFNSENGKYCDGIANHWYSGDHFGELKAFNKTFPNKISVASESCCAIYKEGIDESTDLINAERYAHDILNGFENGLNYYCDWNLTVDEHNGPFHNREGRGCFVDAPVFCLSNSNSIHYRLSYYYIGHFSKFVYPNAKIISTSSYSSSIETVGFMNPDNSIVLVTLNRTNEDKKCIIRIHEHINDFVLEAHTIATIVIKKENT